MQLEAELHSTHTNARLDSAVVPQSNSSIRICIHAYILCNTYVYAYMHIHIYTFLHIHTYILCNTYVYAYMHIHIYNFLHIHTYILCNTYVYAYMHIHIYNFFKFFFFLYIWHSSAFCFSTDQGFLGPCFVCTTSLTATVLKCSKQGSRRSCRRHSLV